MEKSIVENGQLTLWDLDSYVEDPELQANFIGFLERFDKFEKEEDAEDVDEAIEEFRQDKPQVQAEEFALPDDIVEDQVCL